MADQPKPLTEDEMILQALSAEVRTKAREIVLAAETLADANLNAGARETAQMINAAARRLSALVHQRETTLARVQRDRGAPIRFANAGECTAPDFHPASMVCMTCGHPAERHGDVDHLGDAQDVPAEAHRHIDHNGRMGPLCTAPIRADGTCTVYPAPPESSRTRRPDTQDVPTEWCQCWARHPAGRTMRCNTERPKGSPCPNAGSHTGAPIRFDGSGS